MSIDAPGPAKRPKKYCDITGYEVNKKCSFIYLAEIYKGVYI